MGGAYKTFIDSLFVTQKKLLRIMSFKNRYDHTNPIFIDLKMLKLPDIIHLHTLLFVHKSVYSLPIDIGFTPMPHNATRRQQNLRIPLCRTTHAQQSVLTRGCKLWNALPQHIVLCQNKKLFKSKIIQNIFNKYNVVIS